MALLNLGYFIFCILSRLSYPIGVFQEQLRLHGDPFPLLFFIVAEAECIMLSKTSEAGLVVLTWKILKSRLLIYTILVMQMAHTWLCEL